MYSGLSSAQAKSLLAQYGTNEIPEKKVSLFSKIIKNIVSPIGLMLVLASVLSFILGKAFDGYFILILIIINIAITLWQESKADNAIKKLNQNLQQKIKVLRDGKWDAIPSRLLVPGDIIQLSSGEVIPVDGELVEANHVSVNESSLTGESLPKDKKVQDKVFSGSFIETGIAVIKVSATGAKTSFGKTLFAVERIRKKSLLEKDIISISKFLTILSLLAVFLLTVVLWSKHTPFLELLTLDLSLVIAGIPISLPTVMTLIIEFGVLALAVKKVIVRRLSALEDLANVNFLLTDKTGTLTENKISVSQICSYGVFKQQDVLQYAAMVASFESDNPIDLALIERAKHENIVQQAFSKVDFTPADSTRKRSTLVFNKEGKEMTVSLGAAQIVSSLCVLDAKTKATFEADVAALAEKGYRTVALAVSESGKEEKMQLVGLLALSDTLRPDAKSVIDYLKQNNIGVAIVTGDNKAIAKQISGQLGMNGRIVAKAALGTIGDGKFNEDFFTQTDVFAEILPEDKLHLVEAAKKYFVVASNGDGVNDLPAVKAANVGFAVKNAVAVLKASADIVLLSDGISVIRDAIIESRKIFERIYTYSLYRISESLRLILTITILGVWYGVYPMTALQIILLALLNDIPIISLASDRVNVTMRPAKIDAKKRFTLSSLYGLTGVANSIILFLLMRNVLHFSWPVIQTVYFLKLTVSGHMLIYVAHTSKRWWRFLPSKQVIAATSLTQLVATVLTLTGFLMPGKLNVGQIVLVWVWSFGWMQVAEGVKMLQHTRT
jgi:H+-transporting ATPase